MRVPVAADAGGLLPPAALQRLREEGDATSCTLLSAPAMGRVQGGMPCAGAAAGAGEGEGTVSGGEEAWAFDFEPGRQQQARASRRRSPSPAPSPLPLRGGSPFWPFCFLVTTPHASVLVPPP